MGKIEFKVNEKKALEAMLYIAEKLQSRINIYNLLKMIFEADKYHLNLHARPVTGDVYIKMQYGTVPSVIYDFIKQDPLALSSLNIEEYPFRIDGHFLVSQRSPDLSCFSASDLEALNHGFTSYNSLDFKEVETKNHQEQCWLSSDLNRPIEFEKMIENKEVLDYLQQISPFSIVV